MLVGLALMWAIGEFVLWRTRLNDGSAGRHGLYVSETMTSAQRRAYTTFMPWALRLGIPVFLAITALDSFMGSTIAVTLFVAFLVVMCIAYRMIWKKFEAEESSHGTAAPSDTPDSPSEIH